MAKKCYLVLVCFLASAAPRPLKSVSAENDSLFTLSTQITIITARTSIFFRNSIVVFITAFSNANCRTNYKEILLTNFRKVTVHLAGGAMNFITCFTIF